MFNFIDPNIGYDPALDQEEYQEPNDMDDDSGDEYI